VADVVDYRDGAAVRPRWLGSQALVVFELEGGGRVLARPSGTEPKLKIYVDLRAALEPGDDAAAIEARLEAQASRAAGHLAAFLGFE
jgi:phosphomannomutase